uniref:Uncharacterized protein n=1 Tax=Equus caballus TaxID=9796 RepID=A0A9L0RBV2_HORSE
MMLSKRMTAKRRELKPASQARKRMVKESSDCQPAGCDKPPDSPAGAGFGGATPPAALCAHWAPGPWWPCRLFPRAMRPLHGDELRDDLCLLSGAEGSAMLCPGGGSRSSPPPPPGARGAGRGPGGEEEEEEEKGGGGKSAARSRPQRREAGGQRVEAAAGSLRLSSGRDRRSLNSDGPCAPLAIRVPSAAAAAAKADGTRAPEKEKQPTEAAPQLGAAMTFPLTPAARPAVRSGRRSPLESGRSSGYLWLRPRPNRNWLFHLSQCDRSVRGRA